MENFYSYIDMCIKWNLYLLYPHRPKNPLYEPYDGPVVTDYASVGARYRARQTSSVADVTIPITISWKDVNVYATPQNRGFCRGPPPGAEPKHILRNGKASESIQE